jgi:chromosome segregation ATPase
MTDNQFNQLFDLVTKTVTGIQELKQDVSELKQDLSEVKADIVEIKSDVAELKDGQKRIEKEMRLNNQSVNQIAGEQVRMNNRITDLERASV